MNNKIKIKKYIQDYKFNSLFFKNLILIFLLMIVPLMGAGFLAYFAYSNMQKNEIYAYSKDITKNNYDDLQNILKSSQTELIYIGVNSNVELYMYEANDIKQFNRRITSIQDLIRLPVVSKDYIEDIYIYSFANDQVITMDSFENYETFAQKDGLDSYLNSNQKDTYLMPTQNNKSGYTRTFLTIFQPIRYGKNTYGIACMDLNIDELDSLFTLPENSSLYLVDGNQILYSNHPGYIGTPRDTIPDIQSLNRDSTIIQDNYVLSSVTASESSLEMITSLNRNNYQNQLAFVRNFMILFLVLMLLLMVLLTISISIRIFHPIDEIIRELRKNQPVLMGEGALFQEQDELGYILHSIQQSANLKKDVDQELMERVKLLKKAQAIALQSQINPHFLNNTLDTINWISIGLLGGKNQISEMTAALSKMLRMTLENTDSIIPLSTEIEHCNCYLDIQNIRYEGKYEIKWCIPEELYRYKTIRIILQPVVENAIYHGVKYLSANGLITISGKAEYGIVELTVEDNGLGMNAQELADLTERMNTESIKESRHIGLANVNQRLRLYFGEEYGIFIESQEGQGTRVFIRFPQIL